MFELIRRWYERTFTNPQVVILGLAIVGGLLCILLLGKILAPVIAAVIIAYLLEGLVGKLENFKVPRLLAVYAVFSAFVALLLILLFGLAPLLSRQIAQLVQQVPNYLQQVPGVLLGLTEKYPQLFTEDQMTEVVTQLGTEVRSYGEQLLKWSWSSALGLFSLIIFLVLIPLMVFFFLKDKVKLIQWVTRYLPNDRQLVNSVWQDVDRQIGNYVRGKALEIFIVGAVTWVTFSFLELKYTILLATLTGFSVLIPFIGAAVVVVPVAVVALLQFGWGSELLWVVVAYGIIQALDGNVLVPILFSEVTDLHPVAIIIAVLFFGGLWGFWGIFFAIPLATAVSAILRAWPRSTVVDSSAVA